MEIEAATAELEYAVADPLLEAALALFAILGFATVFAVSILWATRPVRSGHAHGHHPDHH